MVCEDIPSSNGTGTISRITTQLYDKRDQPAFTNVRLSRFIAPDSSVNEAAKRSILTGQFHRLRRVILDYNNFCKEMARVIRALVDCGYHRPQLETTYRQLLAAFPQLFYHERRALLVTRRLYEAHGHPLLPAGPNLPSLAPPSATLYDLTMRYLATVPASSHPLALPHIHHGQMRRP